MDIDAGPAEHASHDGPRRSRAVWYPSGAGGI